MTEDAKWDVGKWNESYWDVTFGTFGQRRKRKKPELGPPVPHPPIPNELMSLVYECLETEVFEP